MTQCKICGKEYNNVGSEDWSNSYCSSDCWFTEFKNIVDQAQIFVDKLNLADLKMLNTLFGFQRGIYDFYDMILKKLN